MQDRSKLGIVIQARLGSKRLPKKVLLKLPDGKNVLEHIIEIAIESNLSWIVTTPDEEILRMVTGPPACRSDRCYLYNSERNIHNEIVMSAESMGFEHVVRITGDCPLITSEDILRAVKAYRGDYIYHGPDGRDVEIFPLDQFKKFPNDNDNPTKFFRHNGLSLDTQEDYEKICRLLKKKNV